MKPGGTNVLLDLRGELHDWSIFLTMPCVTGQYSELPRAIVGSPSSTKEAPGPRRLKLAWSQPMVTIVILGSVAVGGLLATTGYRICRNEILALKNRGPNRRLLLSTGSATREHAVEFQNERTEI
jgi:hypothetical protein